MQEAGKTGLRNRNDGFKETIMILSDQITDLDELISFRLEANVKTYAACMNEVKVYECVFHGGTLR